MSTKRISVLYIADSISVSDIEAIKNQQASIDVSVMLFKPDFDGHEYSNLHQLVDLLDKDKFHYLYGDFPLHVLVQVLNAWNSEKHLYGHSLRSRVREIYAKMDCAVSSPNGKFEVVRNFVSATSAKDFAEMLTEV